MKYYRVKKDTFMWEENAILTDQGKGQYVGISDIWNKTEDQTEYISANLIEDPDLSDYFERVYQDNLNGSIFRLADQMKEVYQNAFAK